jgi:hypothetical protein
MLAKSEHQSCGLDKLGVTGSSPVPPIEKPCIRAFVVAQSGDYGVAVARTDA